MGSWRDVWVGHYLWCHLHYQNDGKAVSSELCIESQTWSPRVPAASTESRFRFGPGCPVFSKVSWTVDQILHRNTLLGHERFGMPPRPPIVLVWLTHSSQGNITRWISESSLSTQDDSMTHGTCLHGKFMNGSRLHTHPPLKLHLRAFW